MKQVETARIDAPEEDIPPLQVVAAPNGATKKEALEAPLVLRARIHARHPRPELAALGWQCRSNRIAASK